MQSISLMAWLAETQNIWGPFLVISPASTLHNWQQEITKFAPQLRALPYWGNTKDRKTLRKFWTSKKLYSKDAPFHVLVTSYQLVVSDQQYFQRIKWQYMILDEAHAIKSSSTARWKTLLTFNCRNRLLLTGTPIQNSMQELWALLHFIMPTLFDSHEEFSEWFSKDIESHAEKKGSLNEHQLRRLHMILKPFMLRRVKKDVEHELGDKIEKAVYCGLTARQRRMYDALNERISIDELLEKATFDGKEMEDGDNLMNLVMQFRKVCNHPQIFEAAEVQSPMLFFDPIAPQPMLPLKEPPLIDVPYNARNPIRFVLPKFLYRNGTLGKFTDRNDEGTRLGVLEHLMNIHRADYVHDSLQSDPQVSTFGFLRLLGIDCGEWEKIYHQNFLVSAMDRWKASRNAEIRESYGGHSNSSFSSIQSKVKIGDSSALAELVGVYQDPMMSHSLSILPTAFQSRAEALPISFECSDRSFAYEQQSVLQDRWTAAVLFGIPELVSSPVLRQEITSWTKRLPTFGPMLQKNHGFNNIWVPNAKQLLFESGKLQALDKLLADLKAEGHRVLIYFQMTKMIDIMEEYLAYRQYTYLRLDGSSKISDRRDMVMDWQTRDDIFIFLLSTRAGGLGINLTAADTGL